MINTPVTEALGGSCMDMGGAGMAIKNLHAALDRSGAPVTDTLTPAAHVSNDLSDLVQQARPAVQPFKLGS